MSPTAAITETGQIRLDRKIIGIKVASQKFEAFLSEDGLFPPTYGHADPTPSPSKVSPLKK